MLEVVIKKQVGAFCLDVSFSAEKEVLALLGGSGCGKSMTLRCIAGIETPDSGKIVLDGVTLFDSEKKINLPPQKRKVGLLFQNYALFPNMTVEENIICGIREKLGKAEKQRRAAEYIRKFHLTGLEHHLPSQLSGGQQQRTALARMLIGAPKLLMLDEPFSALDSYLRWEMERELVSILKEYEGTVLFVSHDRDEVYRISQRVAVYGHGSLDIVADKWELFRHPKTRNAARLTGCKNVTDAYVKDGSIHAPAWGLTVPAGDAPKDMTCLGIRARKILPAEAPGEGVYPYELLEVVEGAFSFFLTICFPEGKEPLTWEVTKSVWAKMKDGQRLLSFGEDAVLYLEN